MVHGMVKVHNITSAVTSGGSHINYIITGQLHQLHQLQLQLHLWHKKKLKNHYQLWGLASKPITTSHYQ